MKIFNFRGRWEFRAVVTAVVACLTVSLSFLSTLQISVAAAQNGESGRTPDSSALSSNDFGAVYFLGSFSSAKDLVPHSGICGAFGLLGKPPVRLAEMNAKASNSHCDTAVDVLAGSVDFGPEDVLSAPYAIATDSKDRVIVADRGIPSVHIFDFINRKHSRIAGGLDGRLQSPSGLAVDGQGQLYITDVQLGAILVYNSNGKFLRYIGKTKRKRLFERPAGIVIDATSGHIYVADPPRNTVVILDPGGTVLGKLGLRTSDSGAGQFEAPTHLAVRSQELFVLDSRNNIQVFDLAGNFRRGVNLEPTGPSLGFAIDSVGRIYVDGTDSVRVFERDGRLLFKFGNTGGGRGEINGPTGLWIDRLDRIYVADTGNHRVQAFEWGIKHGAKLPRP